jgi:ABC-type branched-subunit amino acid transport system substrate-binding protein
MSRRVLLSCLCVLALALPLAVQASSASDPGVTSTSILLGGTVPLSGEASSGGLTAKGADAFFKYTNAHRGVSKRKITYDYKDDAYDPAKTIQATRELVQQDHVFAIFNPLGTAHNIATRPYLNSVGVPQLFVASGWGGWASQAKQYPLTIGLIPTYTGEGVIYGRYIKSKVKGAKIGVLYQDDEYGRELLSGLKKGLGSKQGLIVSQRSYDPTSPDVQSQIAALKGSGANVVLIFAFGKYAIQSFVYIKKLGWKPKQVFVNAVAAATSVMQLASTSGQTNGAISIAFFKDPADPAFNKDKGMKLYKSIMAKYGGGGKPGPASKCKAKVPPNWCSGYYLAGMVSASVMVDTLKKAGKNLSRKSLMQAALHLNVKNNPFVLPGIKIKTSPTDRWPIEQAQLERWRAGRWHPFGKLVTAPRK